MSFDTAEFEPFSCEVDPHRESVFVRPVGELDLATAPIVDAQLCELVEAGFTSVVLDLRKLRFLDSTGLRLLLVRQRPYGRPNEAGGARASARSRRAAG